MGWLRYGVLWVYEQVLPFLFYLSIRRKQLQRASGSSHYLAGRIQEIGKLSIDEAAKYLEQEHERGRRLDEKTFKLGGAASLGQTVLGSLSVVISSNSGKAFEGLLTLAFVVSVVFAVMGGVIALGALRTMPVYGYGATHFTKLKNNGQPYLAEMCARQEIMNLLRHARNECSYMCLRNGFVVLAIAWTSIYAIRAFEAVFPSNVVV